MSLIQKTSIGIFWNFLDKLSRRGIGVVITLLLARLLTPEDYGLVAMLAVFIAISNKLVDIGFSHALIRKKDPNQGYFSTAFYTNFVLGMLSYLLLFIIAPLISAFYEEPRLTILIRVLGIVIIFNAFQVVQNTILTRNLNFKKQLAAGIPSSLISGLCAVIMAYFGFGVWSLIAQSIISYGLYTAILWSMNIWKPTFVFEKTAFYDMFSFGSKMFLNDILSIVFQNIYIIVIAKYFAATIAGHYFFANKLKELVLIQLVNSIQVVTYPALSILQDDDKRLKEGYRMVIQATTFGLFPVMLFMAALAEPLFKALLNDEWLSAVPYLQLMCIASLMYPLHSINLNMLKVKGRSDLYLYTSIIKKLLTLIILAYGIQFGVMGILVGQVISSLISYLPNSYYSGKLISYPAREQIKDILPTFFLSAIIAFLVYACVEFFTLPPLIELVIFGTFAGIMYVVSSYILKIEAMKIAEKLLKDKFGEKS